MKKALLILLVLGVIGGTGSAYYIYQKKPVAPTVNTAAITRGDVVDTVGATGTLQAVTTVQVGTQVSGIIQDLYADFNSLVKKGQVLARLDPSTIQTQIDQSDANLVRARADLDRLKVAYDDAQQKLARAQELSAKNLIPQADLETAQVNVRSAASQIKSSEAAVTQAQASLKQNQVNLEHTVIQAPIDGLVISRNVDRGQTVAASMQAPTLFVLAADLTKMQVVANLDESDVGRIRPGQHVAFRVDAYPADDFTGLVSQVRLQPIVQQNVVTYATVIDVPNPELKLKPGMTANVNVEIARRNNVLRLPNAALRFRPTNEIFAALGLPAPDPAQLRASFGPDGQGRGGRSAGQPSAPGASAAAPSASRGTPAQRPAVVAPAPAAAPASPPASPANPRPTDSGAAQASADANALPPGAGANGRRGSGGRGGRGGGSDNAGGGGRGGFAERMQNLSPEERDQMLARMRARGSDPTAANNQPSADNAGGGRGRGRAQSDPTPAPRGRSTDRAVSQNAAARTDNTSLASKNPAATTIDALFGPLPVVESTGRVWLYQSKELKPVRVRVGISDGQTSELIQGDLEEGTEVVTNVIIGSEARPAAGAPNPFLGQQPGRGGFPGGGGNNRGGGGRGR